MENLKSDCSLGDLLESYLDTRALDSEVSDNNSEASEGDSTSWDRWKNFCTYWHSEEHGLTLQSLLSDTQKHSYQLLLEWAATSDRRPSAAKKSTTITSTCAEDEEINKLIGDEPSSGENAVSDGKIGMIEGFDECFDDLLSVEFSLLGLRPRSKAHIRELEEARKKAALKLYCQRMATYCYDVGHERIEPAVPLVSGSPDVISSISLEDGPRVRSCPWLDDEDSQEKYLNGWPYYLLDIDASRTVRTSELNDLPAYTAISHTWGRWRDNGKPPVEIEGVPWPIPQNKLFDVPNILQSLRASKVDTAYVWLDLVCIPQDNSDIAIQEIGRQADIFRNASRAIAWLHDVTDLSCLSAVFRWLALSLLDLDTGSGNAGARNELMEREWLQIAHNQSGLLVPRVGALNVDVLRVNSWFTSLWTLQEVCLRPDMLLASSEWSTLSVDRRTRVPLSALLLVFKEHQSRVFAEEQGHEPWNTHFDSHFAFFELRYWRLSSSLENLFDLTRIDIIRLGDRRECEMRRSEAIMSALGTTKWFHQIDHSQHESNLVLGKYHPDFIEEVRRAMPGDFFGALHKRPLLDWTQESIEDVPEAGPFEDDDDAPVVAADIERYQWASLLPFSTFGAHTLRVWDVDTGLEDYHFLGSWNIEHGGEVRIRKACVLSSSIFEVPRQPAILPCVLIGFDSIISGETKTETGLQFDLHQWTRTRSYEVQAIVVKSYSDHSPLDHSPVAWVCTVSGILIRRLYGQRFFKFGNFVAVTKQQLVLPDAVEIDWTVI